MCNTTSKKIMMIVANYVEKLFKRLRPLKMYTNRLMFACLRIFSTEISIKLLNIK